MGTSEFLSVQHLFIFFSPGELKQHSLEPFYCIQANISEMFELFTKITMQV